MFALPGFWEVIIILIICGVPVGVVVFLILMLKGIRRDVADIKTGQDNAANNPPEA